MVASPRSTCHVSLITCTLVLFATSLLTKIGCTIYLNRLPYKNDQIYSYEGDDYPNRWPIDIPRVLMASDNTIRYDLNSSDGIAEWSTLVPGDGLIYLGKQRHLFMTSMLHQLRCLDIMRNEIVRYHNQREGGEAEALSRHCLNYIKQMVLCRADRQLESFQYGNNEGPVDLLSFYECNDWEAVMKEVKKNQMEYASRKQPQM